MFPLPKGKPEFRELEEKQFDHWNEQKKLIQSGISQEKIRIEKGEKPTQKIYINEREIWFAALGKNIGNESNGKGLFLRPVIVVRKVGNMFFVVPLTTHGKISVYNHDLISVQYNPEYQSIPDISRAQLSQARTIDRARFSHHIGLVSSDDFKGIKKKLSELLLGAPY